MMTATTTKTTKSTTKTIRYWGMTGSLANRDLGSESVRVGEFTDELGVFARRVERLTGLDHVGTSVDGAYGEHLLSFGRANREGGGTVLGTVRVRISG